MQGIRGKNVAFRKSGSAAIMGMSPALASAAWGTEENDVLVRGRNTKQTVISHHT